MPDPLRFPRGRCLPGLPGIAAGLLALVLFALARRHPETVEAVYGRGVYPGIARALGGVSGIVDASLAEWCFVAIALSLAVSVPLAFVRARRRSSGRARSALASLTALLGVAGGWWTAFVLLWGLNYARPIPAAPFELGAPPGKDGGRAIVQQIARRLDEERALVEEDETGVARTPDLHELDLHLRGLQAEVLREAGFRPVEAGRAKRFAVSPVLLRWGVSGMYGPFTGEPNIVVPAPPALLANTLAHERAHLSGFAAEETASFVALLTCWRSPRPEVRYAAWLALWLEFGYEPAERSEGVRRDVAALNRFLATHRGREAPTVWRVYSGYLKAHGVKGGTKSYGRVASLALRWLSKNGFPQVPGTVDAVLDASAAEERDATP